MLLTVDGLHQTKLRNLRIAAEVQLLKPTARPPRASREKSQELRVLHIARAFLSGVALFGEEVEGETGTLVPSERVQNVRAGRVCRDGASRELREAQALVAIAVERAKELLAVLFAATTIPQQQRLEVDEPHRILRRGLPELPPELFGDF